jgi:EAL domain-containing protein (putative c-di-GMP-specific phosphodiesterase class I)
MCKSLHIDNIFEGVETKNELDMVMQLHDKAIVQGYYFSKPLDTDAVNDWLLATK